NFAPSTSSSLTQTVLASDSTTLVSSAPGGSTVGQSVTFTATVANSRSTVGGTPAGTVAVTGDGSTPAGGTVTLNASGVATFTTSSLGFGNHTIVAAYNGSSTFAASTSPTITQSVKQGSATSLASSAPSGSLVGSSVTFTATVT